MQLNKKYVLKLIFNGTFGNLKMHSYITYEFIEEMKIIYYLTQKAKEPCIKICGMLLNERKFHSLKRIY